LDTVVVEVKGCWNPRVKADLEDQLVQKYLLPPNWTFGIYVVGWFVCDAWENAKNYLESADFEAARQKLIQLAHEASVRHANLTIAGQILDCRYR
jgi:hypothetical protein